MKLYDAGAERLESDFDIAKVLRTIRNNRLLLKDYLITPEMREAITNNPKKLIKLDTSDESLDENELSLLKSLAGDGASEDTKLVTKPPKVKGI